MAEEIDPRLAETLIQPSEDVSVEASVSVVPVVGASIGLSADEKIDRLASAFSSIQNFDSADNRRGNLFKTLASAAFWNDALTRALNTALQVSLAAVGTGAVGLTEIDYLGILNLAGGGAVISFMTSLVRATTPK